MGLLAASGTAGIYVEPRSADAREVGQSFAAIRGLEADGPGCNPHVHLGMVEPMLTDPQFWAISQTLRTVRACGDCSQVREMLARMDTKIHHGTVSLILCWDASRHWGGQLLRGVSYRISLVPLICFALPFLRCNFVLGLRGSTWYVQRWNTGCFVGLQWA